MKLLYTMMRGLNADTKIITGLSTKIAVTFSTPLEIFIYALAPSLKKEVNLSAHLLYLDTEHFKGDEISGYLTNVW